MMPPEHLETALRHIQRIAAIATRPDAPITACEALEQLVEELDLAGFSAVETERRHDA